MGNLSGRIRVLTVAAYSRCVEGGHMELTGERKVMLNELDQLQQQHKKLDADVNNITGNVYLTGQEQYDLARLKKLKLATKDRISQLQLEVG